MVRKLDNIDPSDVRSVLPVLRAQVRLSQAALAELAGLARSAVSAIERGTSRPKADTLRLLARGLATDALGVVDAERERVAYNRLMRAAGYIEDAPPPTDAVSTELSDEDIEAAIARYLEDDETAIAFMGAMRRCSWHTACDSPRKSGTSARRRSRATCRTHGR